MVSFGIAIYTSPLLLLLKIILIIAEQVNVKYPLFTARDWSWLSAIIMVVCAGLLWGVTFIEFRNTPSTITDYNNADADIIGDGIRIATWIQEGVLFLVTFQGLGHMMKTAAKELGAGLIVIHVSLSMALMVSYTRKELFIVDAMLGSMILDAQSNTLSVQLANKDTLAARWQVCMVLLAQLLGLVAQGILIGGFSYGGFEMEECRCFSFFWWAWLNNCSPDIRREMIPLWSYYSLRFLSFIHNSFWSISEAKTLDRLEREERSCAKSKQNSPCTPSGSDENHKSSTTPQPLGPRNVDSDTIEMQPPEPNKNLCSCCIKILSSTSDRPDGSRKDSTKQQPHNTHVEDSTTAGPARESTEPGTGKQEVTTWDNITATVTLTFLEFSAYAILSMYSAEVTMGEHSVEKSSPVHSIGQVTALVVACTTGIRAFWVFSFYLYQALKGK